MQELRREFREYWDRHSQDDRRLREQLELASRMRSRLTDRDPVKMPPFLDWFEHWFLKKAAPVQPQEEA